MLTKMVLFVWVPRPRKVGAVPRYAVEKHLLLVGQTHGTLGALSIMGVSENGGTLFGVQGDSIPSGV